VSDFESVDFFTDESLIPDPYQYFDYLRSKCPIMPDSRHGVVALTGHNDALAVYKDPAFSSCVSVAGPFSGLPFKPEGDDIGALIEEHRSRIPMSEHIVTQDPPEHTRTRGLLSRLLTPSGSRKTKTSWGSWPISSLTSLCPVASVSSWKTTRGPSPVW